MFYEIELKYDLTARFLKSQLEVLRTQAHHHYALLMGLPKKNCYIQQIYDAVEAKALDNPHCGKAKTWSFKAFLDRYDRFQPDDAFGIYLFPRLNRIDDYTAEDYYAVDLLRSRKDFSLERIESAINWFLKPYCEKCLRDNKPFYLTDETIARYGFLPEDVAQLKILIDAFNAEAKAVIRSEYNALARLDFIRERKR